MGRPGAPLDLIILCALRYLGRGWTFDDIEGSPHGFLRLHLGKSTHILFYSVRSLFLQVGSTVLYDRWVITPVTEAEAASSTPEYDRAGFHGGVASSDGTHVILEKCFA